MKFLIIIIILILYAYVGCSCGGEIPEEDPVIVKTEETCRGPSGKRVVEWKMTSCDCDSPGLCDAFPTEGAEVVDFGEGFDCGEHRVPTYEKRTEKCLALADMTINVSEDDVTGSYTTRVVCGNEVCLLQNELVGIAP